MTDELKKTSQDQPSKQEVPAEPPPYMDLPYRSEQGVSKTKTPLVSPPVRVPTVIAPLSTAEKYRSRFKLYGLIALITLFLLSVPGAIYLVQQRQTLKQKAQDECPPEGCEIVEDIGEGEVGEGETRSEGLINGCIRKDCDTDNFSPGHLICIEQWRRADGSTYEKTGSDTGETCTSEEKLITDCVREECDLVNFTAPGQLICIEKWQRADGSTYEKTGSPTAKPCTNCQAQKSFSGATTPGYDCKAGSNASVTLTACIPDGCPLTGASVSYSKTEASCPGKSNCEGTCGTAATTQTLQIPAGQKCASVTVSCSPPNCGSCQVDLDSYGVRRFESSLCTTTETAQCRLIIPYDTNWNPLDLAQLSKLKSGEKVRFAAIGHSTTGSFTQARFRINAGDWQITSAKKPGIDEFYLEYTIPPGTSSFRVEAQVYHQSLGWQ